MGRRKIPFGADNFLSVLEGAEGGFAIFAGIVIGLSLEGVSRRLLIITAGISIVVNALNSSAVRFSSEHYLDELDGHENKRRWHAYFLPAALEFLVYGIVSAISILPLILVESTKLGVILMTILTILFLFLAGFYRGQLLLPIHRIRDGLEVAGLGVLIIAAGAVSGWVLVNVLA